MNIYYVPILISGILCALLSIITWTLRRRENINRVFSFFTLALALDSFNYFIWFQFGSIDHIHTWIRIIQTMGFLIPIGLILFFFAFTGYDKRMGDKILGIKVRHFQIFSILVFVLCMVLNPFTDLLLKIPDTPKDIWDIEDGPVGTTMYPLFAVIFLYLLVMVFKSYRMTDNKPKKRFILQLALGTVVWILIGYGAVIFIPHSTALYQSVSYLGIAMMSIFYFVAIINYQSDRVHELNLHLEHRVEQLNKEIIERERIEKLAREQQEKLIQSDKMASIGILISGIAHEINNPNNYMLLNSNNLADVWNDLQPFLDKYYSENGDFIIVGMPYSEIRDDVSMMIKGISEGSERIRKIVQTLKDFARKDSCNFDQKVNINDVIDASVTILSNLIKKSTDHFITEYYRDLPQINGNFQQIEQVVINLISNSCQAMDDRKKKIYVITKYDDNSKRVIILVRDEGKGISPDYMKYIMDPFFTTKHDTGGTGLGLSISYKIINDHKGELKFESEPGTGTVATVSLPCTVF